MGLYWEETGYTKTCIYYLRCINKLLFTMNQLPSGKGSAESRPFLPMANIAEANFYNLDVEILQCSESD